MKPGQPNTAPSGAFQTVKDVENSARAKMEKVIADLQHEMASIRTGRASINLFDGIQVEAYGSQMPINHLATLHVPEPSMVTIQPYDVSQIGAIEKAIRASDLGLNPSNDGKIIRVPIPALTEERRKELAKLVKKLGEEGKIKIRNIRRKANDEIKQGEKDGDIPEDEGHRIIEKIQKLTDDFITKVDKIIEDKNKEIMEF